jgi:UDP-N-acetylmuramoylalanine--D-glutamate ligase
VIPVRGYGGLSVGVLGLGRSGLAAARALAEGGARPVCWDDREAARMAAEAEGFAVADLTRERAWRQESEADKITALIVSPGIPHLYPEPHPAILRAWGEGVVVDNDIGLFFRSVATEDWDGFDKAPRIVCVTGSNGKSTTTALIHHVLTEAKTPAQMGGNIGVGALDLEPPGEGEVVVLELSSYQIELARALGPDVAVFLNLSDDHLDRHGGRGGYFAAKERLFEMGGPDRAIVGVDEPEGRFLANRCREDWETGDPVIAISAARALKGRGWSVFARRGHLAEWRRGKQTASFDLRDIPALPGAHNHQNACAAYAACRALGLGPRQIEGAMRSFPGLPHRLERIGAARGVAWVNDSKATNADAAGKALAAFDRVRWIAGGRAKEGGIAPLADWFPRVAKAYLIGESAAQFGAQLGDHPNAICGDLATAARQAWAEAAEGDTILLSPAAASFDQFPDFEARGAAFRDLAEHLMAGGDT